MAKSEELTETEHKHLAANQAINAYSEAIRAGAEPLQLDVAGFLRSLGLSAPDLSPMANSVSISELFRWLRACIAMATSGSRAMGDLSAAVAVRSLSATICKFIPAEGGAEAVVTKARLRSMRDLSFAWPSPDEVRPEALPPLPKNIAKSFTATFFQDKWSGPRPCRGGTTSEAGA